VKLLCRSSRLGLARVVRAMSLLLMGLCAVHHTAAQLSVSSAGGPNYSHTVAVPPGIAGMQPNLAMHCGVGFVSGPLGVGWGLQGESITSRCPVTRLYDGPPRGVGFDNSDKFCLDGQRLIQTDEGGTWNAASNNLGIAVSIQVDDSRGLTSGHREFRTENDTFSRIRAYGASVGSDANGPLDFQVWTNYGQVFEYGTSPASNIKIGGFSL
jgi:hypothetical protein